VDAGEGRVEAGEEGAAERVAVEVESRARIMPFFTVRSGGLSREPMTQLQRPRTVLLPMTCLEKVFMRLSSRLFVDAYFSVESSKILHTVSL
jgi:hypothetical protein